jgi:RNA polymerase sigma factor (sigma-70 family)
MTREMKLLQAAMDGNTAAFEQIVKKYQSLICAITFSGTGRLDISEELAQDTFLSAWKNLRQLTNPDGFRPWLRTIARNMLKNYYRKKKTVPLDPAAMADLSDQTPTPADNLITQEEHIMLEQALMQIPAEYREPLVMFYRQEKSTKQVAVGLGLNESTVRTRLHRARQMLREEIAARLERTLERTAPGKVFTKAVMVAVGGTVVGMSAGANAASATANAAGTSVPTGIAAVMSTITAKIITAAAVAAIAVGAVLAYNHLSQPEQPSAQSDEIAVIQTEPVVIPESTELNPQAAQDTPVNPIEVPAVPITAVATNTDTKDVAKTEPASISQTTEIPEHTEYVFEPNGVLSGLITDTETGEPVTDAEIHISCGRVYQTKTDKDGFYSFDKIESDGNYGISIHSNEYVGIPLTNDQPVVHLKTDGQAVKHFQFPKACMVDVWVVDEEGNGIKNANIVATSPTDSRQTEINRTGSSTYTDENGYVLLGGFKPAETEYLITIWHKLETKTKQEDGSIHRENRYDCSLGHALVKLTDPDVIESARIVLKRGTKVKGYVHYSDGNPASDIKVIASPDWWHCNYMVDGYPVGGDGSFELEYIVPGIYNISAYTSNEDGSGGSSYVVMQAKLPLPEGELLLVSVPKKSPESLVSISGTLTYIGDKEPGYVEVRAYSPIHGHKQCNVGYSDNGKLKNNFILDRLEPGQYKLTFSGANVEDVVIENVEAPCDDIEVEIAYIDKPKIEFMALDAGTGKPLSNFRVRLKKLQTLRGPNYTQEDRWYYFSETVDKHEIEVVGPGTYQIQVVAEGYAPKWSNIINTDKPETATIELTKGATLSGKVINEKGNPVNGAKVMALSYCGGSELGTSNVFSNQQDAVETVNGDFTIQNLPAGMETLKITHPDYTFNIIEDIEIIEGQTTPKIQIVLIKGATVEGYVYDVDGKPEEGVILFFQDAFAYSDFGNEDKGRYGIAVTDSKGFYRVSHLPEKMCYVRRKDEWNAMGVMLRAVVPDKDKIIKLDFGGKLILSGTAVIDEIPLSEVKIQLGSVESPYIGNYCSKTRTDLDGNFIFRGVIEGKYAIYYENPDKRNDWIKLSNVEIQQEDIDVGVIPGNLSELVLTINQSSFGDKRVIAQLYLSNPEKVFGQPLYTSTSKNQEQGQWFFKGVEPGEYVLNIQFSDNIQIRQNILLSESETEWSIELDPPKWTSSVSGTVIGDASQGVALWQENKSVITVIQPDSKGTFKIENLPSGKYIVGSTMSLLNGTEGISQFELHDNEHFTLDIDLSEKKPDEMGFLQVQVIDDQGKPRLDVDIQLKKDGKMTKPLQSTQIGHMFITVPGDYILSVEADGFKAVEKPITLKPIVMNAPKPEITIVNLEKE